MPSVFITGANRGLGLEFVRQYVAEGWEVFAACRDPASASELTVLVDHGVQVVPLDVSSDKDVAALPQRLADHPLDLVINNAGIFGAQAHQSFGTLDAATFLAAQRVNAFAPLAITQGLLPNLRAAVQQRGQARVAMVSSRMGSISDNTTGGQYVYRASKASLNALCRCLCVDLAPLSIHVAVLHPGWVRTDMGGPQGQIDPPQSVAGMRAVLAALDAKQSGRFCDYQGKDVTW